VQLARSGGLPFVTVVQTADFRSPPRYGLIDSAFAGHICRARVRRDRWCACQEPDEDAAIETTSRWLVDRFLRGRQLSSCQWDGGSGAGGDRVEPA
jgi:hypothetical protein